MAQLRPIQPVQNFLAARDSRIERDAQGRRNVLMEQRAGTQNSLADMQLGRMRQEDEVLNNPEATPEQFARVGRSDVGNSLINAQQAKEAALSRLSMVAKKGLQLDPATRKAFAKQALGMYGGTFKELGIDPNPAGIDQMSDEELERNFRQIAMFGQDPNMKSLFGTVSPDKFTPESLRAFQQSGNYGDLKPTSGGQNIGNFNPGDYTPQSFARFLNTNNPNDLQRYVTPANPSVQVIGGVPTVVHPDRGGGAPTQNPLSTLQTETDAASQIKGAEALGGGRGKNKAEIEKIAPKMAEKSRQLIAGIDNVFAEIDNAASSINRDSTGVVGRGGRVLTAVTGIPTAGYDLEKTLTTIKANIGFDRLQAMRDASPTGGALGQVAIQELEALQASIASLDQGQSPEQLKRNVQKVRRHYEGWKKSVIDAQRQYPVIHQNGSPEAAQADANADPLGILSGGTEGDPLGILR